MMYLLSFLGLFIDRSRLNISGKDRYKELEKQFNKTLGAIGWIFVLIIFSTIGIIWVWYAGTHPSGARFFTISQQQSLKQNTASVSSEKLSKNTKVYELPTSFSPQMSNVRVQEWVSSSLMEIFSFNFNNYQSVLNNTSILFRPDTYRQFLSELNKKNGILTSMKANSTIVSLTPTGSVRIIQQGHNGKYRLWKVEMKALIFFTGAQAEGNIGEHVNFQILVEEVSPTQNPYGLVIAKISQTTDD